MIKVNLLPRKVTKKKMTVIRHVALGGVLLGVVLIALGYWYFLLSSKVNSLKEQVAAAEQEKERLKNVNQEKEQHQKVIDDLKHRIDVISQIEKGRSLPIHLMDELTRILDEKMPAWLEQLNFTGSQILINGYTFTNTDLSRLLRELENSPYIKNVNLVISQVSVVQGKEIYRFTVNAEMESPQGG